MNEAPIPAIKDTWTIALKVWWSYAWRVLLLLTAGAALIIAADKYLPGYLHIKKPVMLKLSYATGSVYMIFMTILGMKSILNKRFKGFSLVLIKTK